MRVAHASGAFRLVATRSKARPPIFLQRALLRTKAPLGATSSFLYDLPNELIATEAAEPRDASRLLVCVPEAAPSASNRLVDTRFSELADLLPPHTHLVMNHSAVFSARLWAQPSAEYRGAGSAAGSAVEVMILGPEPPERDVSTALLQPANGQQWRAMVRLPLEQPGLTLHPRQSDAAASAASAAAPVSLRVERLLGEWIEEDEVNGVEAVVRFEQSSSASAGDATELGPPLRELFDTLGETPLPPYMRREARAEDRERYQTVYSSDEKLGSVAAPTAGLHFTQRLLDALDAGGVKSSRVALHVGAGTFKPVTANSVAEHQMHAERFSVAASELEAIAASAKSGHPIVPVGTTSARVLESLYWLGIRRLMEVGGGGGTDGDSAASGDGSATNGGLSTAHGGDLDLGHLDQWSGYAAAEVQAAGSIELPSVLSLLAADARSEGKSSVGGSTSLCIAPGYSFRVCDAIITNFHAPDSSLMMLVSAMVGSTNALHAVYRHALASRYRFLSYGDACLLFSASQTARSSVTAALATSVRDNLTMADALRDADASLAAAASGSPQAGVSSPHAAAGSEAEGAEVAQASHWSGPRLPAQHVSGRKVLLHSCCAPCSGAMVEAMVGAGHDVTVFFYNPNIHPRKECTSTALSLDPSGTYRPSHRLACCLACCLALPPRIAASHSPLARRRAPTDGDLLLTADEIRKEENKRYAASLNIDFVDLDGPCRIYSNAHFRLLAAFKHALTAAC